MSIKLEHTHVDAWRAVVMQNDAMRVIVVPEIGGKIISLVSRRTGREWLWKNPHLPLRKPPADATDFGAFDAGGWDEVFPTVNSCQVPNSAWNNRTLTDHGELWYRPWQIVAANVGSQADATLTLAVDDPELPFRFERTLTLAAGVGSLTASYSLDNRSKQPLPFIWAAHPLLAIEPGELIRLPAGTRTSLTYSVGLKLAAETTAFAWPMIPLASGESLDISRVPDKSACYAVKLFAENVADGAIEIVNRNQTEVLRLSSEASHASHIGLWLNYGAWSGANTAPYYNAGIEPATFPADDLNVAASHKTMAQLAPGSTRQWAFTVSFRLLDARSYEPRGHKPRP
jgi:galactose mutarotase-like enzyme